MQKYQLLWGIYVQWTKTFNTDEEAVKAAKEYIARVDEEQKNFALIKLTRIM